MRKLIFSAMILLAAASGGCESCQPGGPSPGADVTDTEIVEISAGSDGSGSDVDSGTADVDAADAPSDVTNPAAGVCDKDLPKPGEPCAKLGEVRCTNVDAIESFINIARCLRPNSVICQQSGTAGTLEWVLAACPLGSNPCSTTGNYCADGKLGGVCVPARLRNNENPQPPGAWLGGYGFVVCEGHLGLETCVPAWPARCTTFDQLTPEVKDAVLAVLPPCVSSLSDVSYLFPTALCPPDELYCKSIPATASTPPGKTPVYLNKCVVDKATGKPRCAKTCEDMGVKEVW